MKSLEFIVSIVIAVVLAIVIAVFLPGKPAEKLQLAFQYAMLVMLFLFALLILAAIASGKIDISQLISEHGSNAASMSRFQLLIFTFVISMSFFLIVVCKCEFPNVPVNVLALLGISATTYGVSKGISASAEGTLGPKGGKSADEKSTGETKK